MMFLRKLRIFTRLRILLPIALICLFIIYSKRLHLEPFFTQWSYEPMDCHYDYTDDVLDSAEDRLYSPSSKSIYFHETSCRGNLNARQSCAVEAATRAHPDWDIHVLFAAPVTKIEGSMKTLLVFRNIQFARVHLQEYARGTPLEDLVNSGALNRTRWRVSHTSDVLRYLTLFKFGGVYLDLDTVAVKSFNSLVNNWSARESDKAVSAGAMSFSRDWLGRIVADMAIRNLADNYRGDSWGHNGPGVITRVLKSMCYTEDVAAMNAETCSGFEVYAPDLFYPIRWQDAQYYFEPGVLESPYVYLYHVWNHKTSDTELLEHSRYANLAKRYCPIIYEQHGEEFGVKGSKPFAEKK